MPFAYDEAGEHKQALVKLRVCPECAYKLNYGRSSALPRAAVRPHKRRRRDEAADAEPRKRVDGDAQQLDEPQAGADEAGADVDEGTFWAAASAPDAAADEQAREGDMDEYLAALFA